MYVLLSLSMLVPTSFETMACVRKVCSVPVLAVAAVVRFVRAPGLTPAFVGRFGHFFNKWPVFFFSYLAVFFKGFLVVFFGNPAVSVSLRASATDETHVAHVADRHHLIITHLAPPRSHTCFRARPRVACSAVAVIRFTLCRCLQDGTKLNQFEPFCRAWSCRSARPGALRRHLSTLPFRQSWRCA